MFLVLALIAVLTADPAATPDPRAEVDAFRKQLVQAFKRGDREALERLIADGFSFVHATGGLDTKAMYIDNLVTSAKAGRPPDIERLDEEVKIHDDRLAVATTRGILRRGNEELPLRSTHVYLKRSDGWQWVAGQSTRLPTRPKAGAALTAAQRKAYAGRYELSDGRILTVREDGEILRVSLPGFREAELIPRTETELAWFNPELNIESQLVFERDAEGNATHAIYRRDGRDVWRAKRVAE